MMEEQKKITQMGGTMRLGTYECELNSDSRTASIYGSTHINERHRHRYEVNNHYLPQIEKAGLVVSARARAASTGEARRDMIELPGHPWFIGCQFHPEFASTPRHGQSLFKAYIEAALKHKRQGGQKVGQVLSQAA